MKTGFAIGSTVRPGMSKIIEEAGELLQVLGKLIATGGEAHHWAAGDLDKKQHQEVADLYAALDFYVEQNAMDHKRIDRRRATKLKRFRQWHVEQG